MNKKAFTLIELLVVVLIIGILAAVALPQYQKAVEKSKAIEGLTILKSVYSAVNAYYLANGTYPTSFNQLDINLPWTGTTFIMGSPFISNEDWSLALYTPASSYAGLIITKIKGPYTGGQFQIWWNHEVPNVPKNTVVCGELDTGTYKIANKESFCKGLFNSTQMFAIGSSGRVYNLP